MQYSVPYKGIADYAQRLEVQLYPIGYSRSILRVNYTRSGIVRSMLRFNYTRSGIVGVYYSSIIPDRV